MSVSTCFVCDSSLSFSSGAGIDTNLAESPLVLLLTRCDEFTHPTRWDGPEPRRLGARGHSHLADALIERGTWGER